MTVIGTLAIIVIYAAIYMLPAYPWWKAFVFDLFNRKVK